ncbi:MAG: hypothetical protein CM15mP102_05340 [Flavobacteriales bacterium]|nr:MAG: hypothetical protein CM15mP102_05340 [Flavobacteriales bacterium]
MDICGGEILFIESSISEGKGNLSITGNLGKIMKESAIIALEFIKSNQKELGIEKTLTFQNIIYIFTSRRSNSKRWT